MTNNWSPMVALLAWTAAAAIFVAGWQFMGLEISAAEHLVR
jgi:hypothetical protein